MCLKSSPCIVSPLIVKQPFGMIIYCSLSKNHTHKRIADGGWSPNELYFTKAACSTQTVFSFLQTLFIALASYSSLNDLGGEQALLFGREKRVSRERASEQRSHNWRSREAHFACPNRRACSQAINDLFLPAILIRCYVVLELIF